MDEENKWPIVDLEGYCQSYKTRGRWQNDWRKSKPSTISMLYQFKTSKNKNGALQDLEIDQHLPIISPYWLNQTTEDTANFVEPIDKNIIRATWMGHATVVPNRFAFKRYRKPPCTIDELPSNLDAVAISHTHYDHLDKNSVIHLNKKYRSNLDWYVPQNSGAFFIELGIPSERLHEMVWWEEKVLKGTSIVFTPTNHYSRRGLLDENVALWGSFAVLGKHGNRFWFGGDTAYCEVFKQIGKKFGPFQLSAIPIGSYAPRAALKYNHIDPDEAVKVHCDIRSEMSIGIHWGTFKTNATEFYLEPKYKIDQARLEFGKTPEGEDKLQFYTIPIGETREGKSVTLQNLS